MMFSHIDRSQIQKSAWCLNKIGREWSSVSFEQLKLNLELENWLKIEKIKIAATNFESRNLRIETFLWERAALKWKSARNTSFRC